MQGIFITGTDTSVGKTFISCGLANALRRQGIVVAARKPVEQRCKRQGGALYPADGLRLSEAAGRREPIETVTPYRLAGVIAPGYTAESEGGNVDLAALIRAVHAGLPEAFRLVEGAGGFLSPLAVDGTNADLAKALGYPVVVVAADRTGCINHARLTVEAIEHRGLVPAAVVVNLADAHAPGNGETRDQLAAVLDVPVLTHRHGRDDPGAADKLAHMLMAA